MSRLTIALACLISTGIAQEVEVPEGHSSHGHVFNEGPRQKAVLIPGCGDVDFPITTKHTLAQKFFNQGIGQLHGYWYYEAERSFRQVAAIDPDCAIAYWGMAMANVDNRNRATGFAWEAYKRRGQASRRERMYIDAYAKFWDATKEPSKEVRRAARTGRRFGRRPSRQKQNALYLDLEELLLEFPNDIEGAAFLVNQQYLDRRGRQPTSAKDDNQGLLEGVFAKQPMHPAHHYRIHLWDRRTTAKRTLDSAWKSGVSAPAIAHMWHMGGHTYDKLGRHADAAWVQEASARVDHAHMIRYGVMPYEIHNYAHNNEWLCRSLRNIGRVADSVDLAKNMIELPRHPKKRDRSGRNGRRRLFETLAMAEQWNQIVALADSRYAEGTARDNAFEFGRAYAMTGQLAKAKAQLALLTGARGKDTTKPEENDEPDRELQDEPRTRRRRTRRSSADAAKQLQALIAFAEGRHDEAIQSLQKSRYSREHLAVLCARAGKHDAALKALSRTPAKGLTIPRATRAWVQWQAGKRSEATATFEELRTLSSQLDPDAPVFARLAPIAKSLGLEADWRVPYVKPRDIGERPPLASLGPFRWSPSQALPWKLPNGAGGELSLSSYAGKPVLVVFFLGFGCVHCVEQLEAIRPKAEDFEKAGIAIVTIGTDTTDQVKASIQQGIESDDPPMPFPILCDPKGEVFKRYRCWDDFEDTALHGTFLIDKDGFVRWQDISFEPFMETEFLLRECKRLLALPVTGAHSARR